MDPVVKGNLSASQLQLPPPIGVPALAKPAGSAIPVSNAGVHHASNYYETSTNKQENSKSRGGNNTLTVLVAAPGKADRAFSELEDLDGKGTGSEKVQFLERAPTAPPRETQTSQ